MVGLPFTRHVHRAMPALTRGSHPFRDPVRLGGAWSRRVRGAVAGLLGALLVSCTAAPVRVYSFPVRPISGASYARTHHDYPAADIFAPCGSDYVAPIAGVVEDVQKTDRWQAATNPAEWRGGLWVSIRGDDGVRYYGSHFASVEANVVVGARVAGGQRIARVGDSGNAQGTGCHVHFGLSPNCAPYRWDTRRGLVAPQPFLDSWRTWATVSPAAAVTAGC